MTTTAVATLRAPLSDESLARVLADKIAQGAKVLVVANGFTALVAEQDATRGWVEIGRGDFGLKAGEAAKGAKAGKLEWLDAACAPSAVDLTTAIGATVTKLFITKWLKNAQSLTSTSGRGDMPSKDELQYLGNLAGWRCQFAGCGKDLQRESLSGTRGVFSYFAHIIASSPKGPRGDQLLSGQRTDDIENIMLLCDECHRRVDREDPERFTVDLLRTMRQDSINEVRRLLDSLKYQKAIPLVIMGNVTAQSPRFIQRHAEEAMWTRKLRMHPRGSEHYFYNGGHLHDPHAPQYWGSLFESLRHDIPLLRKRLNGTLRDDGATTPLAIFPLHGTSLLVLAGRVVGEGSSATVFQFDRNRPECLPGGPWAFDPDASTPVAGKYCVKELKAHAEGGEACLIVSLTYRVEPNRLPKELYSSSGFAMGALEVSATAPTSLGYDIFKHPRDIDDFAIAAEEAIRKLQDQWRVKKVHLIVGAPASACFRIGQKLQARNHATVVCYESMPGAGAAFKETIEIANDKVTELQTGQSIALL